MQKNKHSLILPSSLHWKLKQKEFFKCYDAFLKLFNLSTFIRFFKHLDGAWDMFWLKSLGSTFKALQKK